MDIARRHGQRQWPNPHLATPPHAFVHRAAVATKRRLEHTTSTAARNQSTTLRSTLRQLLIISEKTRILLRRQSVARICLALEPRYTRKDIDQQCTGESYQYGVAATSDLRAIISRYVPATSCKRFGRDHPPLVPPLLETRPTGIGPPVGLVAVTTPDSLSEIRWPKTSKRPKTWKIRCTRVRVLGNGRVRCHLPRMPDGLQIRKRSC